MRNRTRRAFRISDQIQFWNVGDRIRRVPLLVDNRVTSTGATDIVNFPGYQRWAASENAVGA